MMNVNDAWRHNEFTQQKVPCGARTKPSATTENSDENYLLKNVQEVKFRPLPGNDLGTYPRWVTCAELLVAN